MSKQTDPMTEADYDACVVAHGTDIALWPATERSRAREFLQTSDGQDASKLDNLFATLGPDEGGNDMMMQADTTDFLTRLQAIPDQYPQQATAANASAGTQSLGKKVGAFIDGLLDPARLWSPTGLAAQGFAFVLLMGVGMFVGAQQGPEMFNDYDVSAGIFEANNSEYSIDG